MVDTRTCQKLHLLQEISHSEVQISSMNGWNFAQFSAGAKLQISVEFRTIETVCESPVIEFYTKLKSCGSFSFG